MSQEKPDSRTFYLQFATLVVGVVGGCIVFFAIDRRLADVDVRLKIAQAQSEEMDVEKKKTPILGVSAFSAVHQIDYQSEDTPGIRQIRLDVLFENLGFRSINLGRVSIQVEEAYAEKELEKLLFRKNQDEPVPAPPAPESVEIRKKQLINPASHVREHLVQVEVPESKEWPGQLFAIGRQDLAFRPVEKLTKDIPLNFELRQAQKRSFRFDYVMAESSKPKWYRFVVSVFPPADDTSWRVHRIDKIESGGGMPYVIRNYTVSKNVYDSGEYPMSSLDQGAPPIPLGDE